MLSTLNVIANHKNNCEDNFLVVERNSIIYGGIFDGCSTGIHSAWASQTISYIVNFAIEQEIDILSDNFINYCLLSELEYMSKRLNISHMNFLSTCILFKYDKTNNIFSIRTFGDCYYYLNDIEYIVDQNNTPDYLGYQMFSKNKDEFFKKYPVLTYYESIKISSGEDNNSTSKSPIQINTILQDLRQKESWINSFNITMLGIGNKSSFQHSCDVMGLDHTKCLVTTQDTAKDMRGILGVVSQSVSSSSQQQTVSF